MFKNDAFAGRVVLVTGGGGGLGYSMAEMLYGLGATVILNGRSQEKLERAREELSSTDGGAVDLFAADIRDADSVAAMFDELEKRHGAVDGLVNNAAGNFLCCSEDLSSNAFRTIVDIVLQGTFHCTQQFGARLIDKNKTGSIVNIVTTYAETGSAFVLPSACAKAGVVAMTKSLAFEWAEFGIRVNAIAPGPFPTKGAWQRLVPDPEFEKLFLKQLPLGRFGEREELTSVVAFLLSDAASYISGDVVTVDGAEKLKAGQFNFLLGYTDRTELRKAFTAMKKG